MPINDTVQISISLDSPAIEQASLNLPLIAGHNAPWAPDYYRVYSELSELTDDGFATTDYEYLAAEAMFSQSPRLPEVAVGLLETFVAQDERVTVEDSPPSGDYIVTINGTEFKHTSPGSELPADIVDALVALINAGSEPVTATDGGNYLDCVADNAGEPFTITVESPSSSYLTLSQQTANLGYYEALGLIAGESDEWWALAIEDRDDWHILEASRYVESHTKAFMAQSSDADILTSATDDIASQIQDLARFRTGIMYYSEDTEVAAEAWLGKKLAVDLDTTSTYWAHATLAGIAPDDLTTTQQTYAEGKNANFYVTLGGQGSTWPGKLADGHWIDQLSTRDWLYFRLTEDLQALFLGYSNRNQKIPYTDAGIRVFGNLTRTRLQRGVNADHFTGDPEPTVTMPRAADVTDADKQARILRWSFAAQFAGAIQQAIISGTVTTSLPG